MLKDNFMILLSGIEVREKIKEDLRKQIFSKGIFPELCIIQIGNNPESNVYINQKQKFGDDVGVIVQHLKFPENVDEKEILLQIDDLNKRQEINGIIVQLPIPKSLNKRKILDAVSPEKDVDGLGFVQQKYLTENYNRCIVSGVASAIVSILDFYNISLLDKEVVLIGNSDLVGKPTSILCKRNGAKVSICDENTKNIKEISAKADILIVACGVPKLVDRTFLKKDVVVIDVGIHKLKNGICGDVDFESVKDVVSAITPVPGGVGPVTVASLFKNVVMSGILQL